VCLLATLAPVTRICDPKGIKLGAFLDALEQNIQHAVKVWRDQAETLLKSIQEPHWTTFTTESQKHYSWCYYGYPKFIIFLEKVDDEVPDALTKTYHHYGEDFAN
ncbi:hypothetical protein Alg130_11940, partial [Pyrenophora tritici-repentis]